MSHLRYHGILLWNGATVDWSSVGTWFGTCSNLDGRIWARGLVYSSPLIAQTTWLGMPDFAARNQSGWKIVSKSMKYVTTMTYRGALSWERHQ